MKNKTIVKIVSGALAVAAMTVGTIAASNKKTADLYYNGITIMIDGAEYVAKDANGNVVAPFIMDGTTYLPVRAVANAFDKDVDWDGKTNTVYIGKKGRMEPDNRLDKIQYNYYTEGSDDSWMEIVNGTVTDYNNNTYTNGLVFYDYYHHSSNGITVDYPLNGQFETLTGKIILPKSINTTTKNINSCKTSETTVEIIDENGDELFSANGITASMPFKFDIDVDGVNMITIKVSTEASKSYVALTDLALYE